MSTRPRGSSLVGLRFGKQVVLRTLPNAKVEVRCDCGTVKATQIQYLRNGQSKSCGCGRYDQRPATKPMQVGDVFHHFTVTQLLGTNGVKREVLAQCSCGNRKVVDEEALRDGSTKSCGCFRRARMAELNHSHGQAGTRRTPLYRAWESMRRRVRDRKRYPTYANLWVFPEWDAAFEPFRDYVNANLGARPRGHSLDRIDNARGYEPGNLRWSNASQQAFNRSSTVMLTIGELTQPLQEWARQHGLQPGTLRQRIRNGVSGRDLIAPVKRRP